MQPTSHKPPGDSDPNQDATPSAIETKQCKDCFAILPLTDFGPNRLGRKGHHNSCKPCIAEYARMKRVTKYGYKAKSDDVQIRSVHIQNERVIKQAIKRSRFECMGFIPHGQTFKVVFGIGSFGLLSMAVFGIDGSSFGEWNYSNLGSQTTLLALLKDLKIRLELTEADLIAAKTTIYYL